jgi:hypothetical protein
MPIGHLMGLIEKDSVEGFDWFTPKLKPENLVFIGLRDIDSGEKKVIRVYNSCIYMAIESWDKNIYHGRSQRFWNFNCYETNIRTFIKRWKRLSNSYQL